MIMKTIALAASCAVSSLLAASVALAQPAKGQAAAPSREFPTGKVKHVRIQTEAGDVSVRGVEGASAKVAVTGSTEDCVLVTEVQGAELVLTAKSVRRHFWMQSGCRAGFSVEAPGGLTLEASVGSGRIEVSAMSSDVEVRTGSGDIDVKDVSGALKARTGSGRIKGQASSSWVEARTGSGGVSLSRLQGSAKVHSGSGPVRLEWAQAPGKGEADVHTGSGDITLLFPEGTKLTTEVKTGSGSVRKELGEAPEAGFRVSAHAGSGNVILQRAAAR
jgi:DUF4097 and DUF4098 domain-containing protein YvlB